MESNQSTIPSDEDGVGTFEASASSLEPDAKELLRFELNSALIHFTQAERPVVLEGLGIVSPLRKKSWRTHVMGNWGITRNETFQSISFEKCEDTSCLPIERFPRLVDTRELVQTIYSRLPLAIQLRWSERELRRLLVQFFRDIRFEVAEHGYSDQLRGVGNLYAIHNRQGQSVSDWFAGADVFMTPRQLRPLSLGATRRFARPVLDHAWELWETLAEGTAWQGQLSLHQSLLELGFPEEVISQQRLSPDELRVALFQVPLSKLSAPSESESPSQNAGHMAVLVSDGLRSSVRKGNDLQKDSALPKLRHELVLAIPFEILFPEINPAESQRSRLYQAPPAWVAQLIAAGAVLLASERANPLRANVALSLGRSLTGSNDCRLRSLFLAPCAIFASQQLASDGPFHYASIIGLARDEAELLTTYGREHLLAILESRGFTQFTIPNRPSALLRSHFSPRPSSSRNSDTERRSFTTTQTVPM